MVDGQDEMLSDSPLESRDDDQLGYSHFSSHLVNAISTRIPTDGFTIGIYGPWGSGKSTILNFVEEEINESEDGPIVIRFDPWWFSGQADLLERFFEKVGRELGDRPEFPNLRKKLSKLSLSISKLPLSTVGIPEGGFRAAAHLLEENEESIDEVKEEISETLKESDRPIVVIIDDIDRLTHDEISQMFQAVKSIANFPNTAYILAFDEDVVTEALEAGDGVKSGEDYLEKIIQLPVRIPVHKEGTLEQILIEQFNRIAGTVEVDDMRFNQLLQNCIIPTLDTPRNATRLSNGVDFNYSAVEGEVNFIDLVGIELLRVFYPNIYDEIRNNPDRFVGQGRSIHLGNSDADSYEDILPPESTERREAAEATLKLLFQKARDNLNDTFSSNQNWGAMRTKKRVCHRSRFSVYFRLSLPDGTIPWARMEKIVGSTDDEDEFIGLLTELLENHRRKELSQASEFLERFQLRLDEIDDEDVANVVRAVIRVADRIVESETSLSQLGLPAQSKMSWIVAELTKREDEADRLSLLDDAIGDSNSPFFTTYLTVWLLREHGKYDGDPAEEDERVLSLEDARKLEKIAAQRIKSSAEEENLISAPLTSLILKYWPKFINDSYLQDWAKSQTENQGDLIRLLDAFVSSSVLRSSTSVGATERYFVDPRWVDPYLDLKDTRKRINSISKDELNKNQKRTIKIYQQGWQYLDDGKDPSSSETWHFSRE